MNTVLNVIGAAKRCLGNAQTILRNVGERCLGIAQAILGNAREAITSALAMVTTTQQTVNSAPLQLEGEQIALLRAPQVPVLAGPGDEVFDVDGIPTIVRRNAHMWVAIGEQVVGVTYYDLMLLDRFNEITCGLSVAQANGMMREDSRVYLAIWQWVINQLLAREYHEFYVNMLSYAEACVLLTLCEDVDEKAALFTTDRSDDSRANEGRARRARELHEWECAYATRVQPNGIPFRLDRAYALSLLTEAERERVSEEEMTFRSDWLLGLTPEKLAVFKFGGFKAFQLVQEEYYGLDGPIEGVEINEEVINGRTHRIACVSRNISDEEGLRFPNCAILVIKFDYHNGTPRFNLASGVTPVCSCRNGYHNYCHPRVQTERFTYNLEPEPEPEPVSVPVLAAPVSAAGTGLTLRSAPLAGVTLDNDGPSWAEILDEWLAATPKKGDGDVMEPLELPPPVVGDVVPLPTRVASIYTDEERPLGLALAGMEPPLLELPPPRVGRSYAEVITGPTARVANLRTDSSDAVGPLFAAINNTTQSAPAVLLTVDSGASAVPAPVPSPPKAEDSGSDGGEWTPVKSTHPKKARKSAPKPASNPRTGGGARSGASAPSLTCSLKPVIAATGAVSDSLLTALETPGTEFRKLLGASSSERFKAFKAWLNGRTRGAKPVSARYCGKDILIPSDCMLVTLCLTDFYEELSSHCGSTPYYFSLSDACDIVSVLAPVTDVYRPGNGPNVLVTIACHSDGSGMGTWEEVLRTLQASKMKLDGAKLRWTRWYTKEERDAHKARLTRGGGGQ